MKIIEANGLHLNVRESGSPDGYPIVFAGSLGTDCRLWDRTFRLMPGSWRMISYDSRGHGLSSCPPGPYSIGELADDCASLLENLGISECVLVGLSIGGLVAQELLLGRPELIRAAVLSNTGARIGSETLWNSRIEAAKSGRLNEISDSVIHRWFSTQFRQSRADELQGLAGHVRADCT